MLESHDYCSSGNQLDDEHTLDYINKITTIAKDVGKFDEGVLFRGENANVTMTRGSSGGLQTDKWTAGSPGRVQDTLP
jgi:hypothetical protein